jgi:hypothetical protein
MMIPQQQVKTLMAVGDVGAFGVVFATLTSILPPIAALLSIVWVALHIYWTIKDRIKNKKDKL